MTQRWALLALMILMPASVSANESLDLNLSSRALQLEFNGALSSLFPRLNGNYNFGALIGEKDSQNLTQIHTGLLVTGDAGARQANIIAGLGGRIAVVDAEAVSGGALALGGMLEARLPAFNRLGMRIYAFGAPRASSFGDLDGYLEYAAMLDYQVIRPASLYAGFRQLKLNPESGPEFSADSGWHLGFRLLF